MPVCGEIDPVEALGIVDQRLVAAGDHILDDGANRVVDVLGRLPLHGEQRHEALFEIRGGSVQTQGHFRLQPGFPGCHDPQGALSSSLFSGFA